MSRDLPRCIRCECSLDVGDKSEDDRRLCVSCSLIVDGVDPYTAMLVAANRKAKATKELEQKP